MPQTTSLVQEQRQAAFLKAFAETGSINGAARLAKVSRDTHYKWVQAEKDGRSTGYIAALAEAKQEFQERLEDEIARRAVKGWLEPVFYKGKPVGTIRKFSDNLLMFRAKGEMPYKYRDNMSVEHSGPGGGPIPLAAIDAVIIGAKEQKQPLQIEAGTGEENAND